MEIKRVKKSSNKIRAVKIFAVVILCILSFFAGRYFEKAVECKAKKVGFNEVVEQVLQDKPKGVVYVDCYALRVRRDGYLEIFKIDEKK